VTVATLSLVKLHGLGNDFLVALDGEAFDAASAGDPSSLVEALCDRHTGIGADGVVVARPATGGGDVAMELRNSDGGVAETSGNGLCCFALAVLDAGAADSRRVAIETVTGTRVAELLARPARGVAEIAVDMGTLKVARRAPVRDERLPGSIDDPWPSWSVDAGNPHLVLVAPALSGVDVAAIGPSLELARSGGQNVEIATVGRSASEVEMVVWERGVGVTLACGTGSAAVAAALHAGGLSAATVRVANPGGTVEVSLTGDPLAPQATLTGSAQRVAQILVEPAEIGAGRQDVKQREHEVVVTAS
jgi:diaminopimelate epimerase